MVKVLRPGMRAVIERDLEVLHALAELAQRYWSEGRRLRPRELVDEYQKTMLDELDLMREAANASQLKRNFAGSELLYVPEVYWDYCRTEVMVHRAHPRRADQRHGEPARAPAPTSGCWPRTACASSSRRCSATTSSTPTCIPGNIFVLLDDPARPRYAAVDFGIVGSLDVRDQQYLAENFLAVFDRDYRRVAQLHLDSGWVPPGTRLDEMESAVRTVCEPILDRPLKDISFGRILLRLFEISRRFNMQIQPQLMLLQKTLLNVEGLGRDLYPDLDVWNTATPILREWMRERSGVRAFVRSLRTEAPQLLARHARAARGAAAAAARAGRAGSGAGRAGARRAARGAARRARAASGHSRSARCCSRAAPRSRSRAAPAGRPGSCSPPEPRTSATRCGAEVSGALPHARVHPARAVQVLPADPAGQHPAVAQRLGELHLGRPLSGGGGAHGDLQRQHRHVSADRRRLWRGAGRDHPHRPEHRRQ